MSKTALITGGSSGIGAAIAHEFAQKGHKVFLTGRDLGRLQEVAQACKAVGYLSGDLLKNDFPETLFRTAQASLRQIDVLVNSAGMYHWSAIADSSRTAAAELLSLNLEVPYNLCRMVVPSMQGRGWGRIINIGSISGAVGEPNASAYSASKAGLIGLTKSLGLELAEFGITVNVINPGWVKTKLIESFESSETIETVPQKRWIEPREVAAMAAYLASEEACGITGQSLNICAGLSLG